MGNYLKREAEAKAKRDARQAASKPRAANVRARTRQEIEEQNESRLNAYNYAERNGLTARETADLFDLNLRNFRTWIYRTGRNNLG